MHENIGDFKFHIRGHFTDSETDHSFVNEFSNLQTAMEQFAASWLSRPENGILVAEYWERLADGTDTALPEWVVEDITHMWVKAVEDELQDIVDETADELLDMTDGE